ncbi:MAG: M48 family metallopeptidase [Oculatellaceae cyanobacterium Prado106]|jgi:Zn-dependent protease with chaperone function|nr:M48 family metallopeptidase [Oculatellaceae cyanobacterium Prado106]
MPTYTGISSEAFRHPLDAQAEQALRSVPGFDLIARKFVEFVYERPRYVYLMGNSIEVGPRQYASVYHLFRECVRDLDVSPEPVLFVSQSPSVNAYALGQEKPCIVLNTAILDLMDETELRAAIAHELGHIKCGHTTLNQMANWVITVAAGLADRTFGLSAIVSTGLIMAFYEWLRKAELSADRAALLVLDELNPVLQSMMRMTGGSSRYPNEISLKEFIAQAERYESLDADNLNQVYKFLLYNDIPRGVFMTHPFALERVTFLQQWSTSEDYRRIRSGNYAQTGTGAVEVPVEAPVDEATRLRQELEDLQRQIDDLRRQSGE